MRETIATGSAPRAVFAFQRVIQDSRKSGLVFAPDGGAVLHRSVVLVHALA